MKLFRYFILHIRTHQNLHGYSLKILPSMVHDGKKIILVEIYFFIFNLQFKALSELEASQAKTVLISGQIREE